MSLRHLMIGLAASLLLAAAAAGCGASVVDGKVLTNNVWFDQTGTAHCPHPDCLPTPKLRPSAEETEGSLVKPHKNVCEKGHPVQWGSDDVVCWACSGAKSCPTCKGTGYVGKDLACGGCLAAGGEESKTAGTGVCSECAGKGTIRYGGVAERPH